MFVNKFIHPTDFTDYNNLPGLDVIARHYKTNQETNNNKTPAFMDLSVGGERAKGGEIDNMH